jgi:nucleoside-diphosphate-sugar epimerase
MQKTVTVLGINGHIGRYAAEAFVAAGWQVRGMGRSDKHKIAGVEFVKGDAENVADIVRAIGDSAFVFNALNLPYDKWFGGALEAQFQAIIDAMARVRGCTLLHPGNIYNYAASAREITKDTPEVPERPRGALRVRCEAMLKAAVARGDMRVIIIRAGDFFGPGTTGDWFDQGILAQPGKLATLSAPGMAHSWAYLPDFGRAFVVAAEHHDEFAPYEVLFFKGNFVTTEQLVDAIQKASPSPLKVSALPWSLLAVIGLFNPVMREIHKMHYLWQNPMRLRDDRLDALLGPDFGTPYDEAIAATVAPFFAQERKAA